MHRIDGPGATADKKFTEGNPGTGVAATQVTADWANAVQEEIAKVIENAGIALNKANNTQLYTAIQALIDAGGGGGGGGATAALDVSIVDSGDYYAGDNVEAALQEVGEALEDLRTTALGGGVIALAASSQTALAHANALLEITSATGVNYTVRPDADADLPIGTAIHVAQGGAGKVTIVAGSGVTIKKGASFNMATMEQEAMVVLIKAAANTWRLGGALEAA